MKAINRRGNITQFALHGYNCSFLSSTLSAAVLTFRHLVPNSRVLQAANIYSSIYLAATTYGVLNDWFATGDSIEYFARGHQPGAIAVNTCDRFTNAFVWGHVATCGLAHIASIIFTTTSLYLSHRGFPQQQNLAPIIIGGSALVAGVIEVGMRLTKAKDEETISGLVGYYDSEFLGSLEKRIETFVDIINRRNKQDLVMKDIKANLPQEYQPKKMPNYIKITLGPIDVKIDDIVSTIQTKYKTKDAIELFMHNTDNDSYLEYCDSFLYKEQTEETNTPEKKYLWMRCGIRNAIGYILMGSLEVLGIYSYARYGAIAFIPNLEINPNIQIAIQATILASILYGDYHVRNHERTWQGPELPEKYF